MTFSRGAVPFWELFAISNCGTANNIFGQQYLKATQTVAFFLLLQNHSNINIFIALSTEYLL